VTASLIRLDIVSAESLIYSGEVQSVTATGDLGELGVAHGHAQLLTSLKPGEISIVYADGAQEFYYVSGGILEVQPDAVSVLADVVIRAGDLDEKAALSAKDLAVAGLNGVAQKDLDYASSAVALAEAVAQLRLINKLRKH
jgi:F-type H+-transporting ATPase subunit epsilon